MKGSVTACLVLFALAGCDRSQGPPPINMQKSSDSGAAADASKADAAKADAASLDGDAATAAVETVAPERDSSDAESLAEKAAHPAAYRLWLPSSKEPLLIGLDVSIDGQPLRDAFTHRLAEIRTTIGADTDAPLPWTNFLETVAADVVTFGQSSARIGGQEKGLIKQYDRDNDQNVDDDELIRFLFRDSGFAEEFRLFGTDAFRWTNRSQSPLFAAIDQDGDRYIDSDESDRAAETLLREIDQDANGCIDFVEVTRLSEIQNDAWQRTRSDRKGNIAMDFGGYVDWSNLSYAMGGMTRAEAILAAKNPVVAIDGNRDQWITADEAASVLDLDPAFHIFVRLSSLAPDAATVETRFPSTARQDIQVQQGQGYEWISRAAFQLGIYALDLPRSNNRIPIEVFRQLDADKNGAIDPSEVPDGAESQFPFDSLDADGDGTLSFAEINPAMKQPQSIWNVQVRGRAAEHPDALFAWLDRDHDQFLSAREIRAAGERLRLIRGTSSKISHADIPETMMIQLGRGEPDQDDSRFQISRRIQTEPDDRPTWAKRMDANRDGDISEHEFVGSIQHFQQFDRDGDHFLSATEISAVTLEPR